MVSPVYMNVLSVSNSLCSLGAFQYSFNKIKSFANWKFCHLPFFLYDQISALRSCSVILKLPLLVTGDSCSVMILYCELD